MARAFEEYRAFLESYASFLEDMSTQAQKLHGALASFNGEQLTKAMSALQSHIMQLKNMEARRMELQEAAGYGGLTFPQLLERRPTEEHAGLKALLRRIEMAVENIKYLNSQSLSFAKQGLAALQANGSITEGKNLYAPPARGRENRSVDASTAFEANY